MRKRIFFLNEYPFAYMQADMNPIKHIRTAILGLTQAEFAGHLNRPQATISRWETGGLRPDIDDMALIRELVKSVGKPWDDSWFFEAPEAAA